MHLIMDLRTTIFFIVTISMTTVSMAVKPADISCYVCSNSKANNNPFYKKNCDDLKKMSDQDKIQITVNCSQYSDYVHKVLHPVGQSRASEDEVESDQQLSCLPDQYNVCRSFYYESSEAVEVKVDKDSEDNPKVGPFDGEKQRVFRFCGCASKKEKEKAIKDKVHCFTIPKPGIHKRYCTCIPDKSGQPCNSSATTILANLQVVAMLTACFYAIVTLTGIRKLSTFVQ